MGIDRDFDNLMKNPSSVRLRRRDSERADQCANQPEVIGSKLLSLHVCVPANWTDEQIISFAESNNPSGVSTKWQIRKTGNVLLCGDPERNPCTKRSGFVHVVLDC